MCTYKEQVGFRNDYITVTYWLLLPIRTLGGHQLTKGISYHNYHNHDQVGVDHGSVGVFLDENRFPNRFFRSFILR